MLSYCLWIQLFSCNKEDSLVSETLAYNVTEPRYVGDKSLWFSWATIQLLYLWMNCMPSSRRESSWPKYDLWSGGVYVSLEGGNHCSTTTVSLLSQMLTVSLAAGGSLSFNVTFYFLGGRWQVTGTGMAGAVAPKRQDTRKFFENLSGAGKSIAVLTSGGDAQGNVA